jgi:hypothetical protein
MGGAGEQALLFVRRALCGHRERDAAHEVDHTSCVIGVSSDASRLRLSRDGVDLAALCAQLEVPLAQLSGALPTPADTVSEACEFSLLYDARTPPTPRAQLAVTRGLAAAGVRAYEEGTKMREPFLRRYASPLSSDPAGTDTSAACTSQPTHSRRPSPPSNVPASGSTLPPRTQC